MTSIESRIAAALMSMTLVLPMVLSGVAAAASARVVPGYRIELPRDEGSHPEFRTEWWYLTGWLADDAGREFGFQVTFFRTRTGLDADNPSRFAARQLLFAHAAISDVRRGRLLRDEKAAREGFGLAGASEDRLDVSVDDWRLRRETSARYRAVVPAREFTLEIEIQPTQAPLLNGEAGFSQKAPQPGIASYYYSLPQLQVSGQLSIGGRQMRVHGSAWFDHEWADSYLDETAQGWDWAGINFDDGGALMVQQTRTQRGKYWAAATLRSGSQPSAQKFSPGDIHWSVVRSWRSPRTGIEYPVEWLVRVGERTIRLRPLFDDQENDTRGSTGIIYWEGAVTAFDTEGRRIGRGYLELTGYGQRLRF